MRVEDFDYDLPKELIAQAPVSPRDAAKLMVVDRQTGVRQGITFQTWPKWLTPQDVVVINQTKVFPARLGGRKTTGGAVELLLLEEVTRGEWQALSQPGLPLGAEIEFEGGVSGKVLVSNDEDGRLTIKFSLVGDRLWRFVEAKGQVPLPPYIHSLLPEVKLRQEYQTVYATETGSAAAPTAGMHFTRSSLKHLVDQGVEVIPITLHVGLGTFMPVKQSQLETGKLHQERYRITKQAAERIMAAKNAGKRIIAVGTTTARTLESAFREGAVTELMSEWQTTDLFIKPPYQFKMVDSLITNFHLPKSSLLMMVTALVSAPNTTAPFRGFEQSLMGHVYKQAMAEKYRFYSFGDGMWIR